MERRARANGTTPEIELQKLRASRGQAYADGGEFDAPSKLQRTWEYLRDESSVGEPFRPVGRLMDAPLPVLLGGGSQGQQYTRSTRQGRGLH